MGKPEVIVPGPLIKKSAIKNSMHYHPLGNISLQHSSLFNISTSSKLTEGKDQQTKENGSINHYELFQPHDTNLRDFGSLTPNADYLQQRGVGRSASPTSTSSEEIIIFGGRKRPIAAKPHPATFQTSSGENSEALPCPIGLTSTKIVPPPYITLCEPTLSADRDDTFSPSRSASADGASPGGASLQGALLRDIERESSISEESIKLNMGRSRNMREYEILADQLDNTGQSNEDDISAFDELSDVSDHHSTGLGQRKVFADEYSNQAGFAEFSIKNKDYDRETYPGKNLAARTKVISTCCGTPQVDKPNSSSRCHSVARIGDYPRLGKCVKIRPVTGQVFFKPKTNMVTLVTSRIYGCKECRQGLPSPLPNSYQMYLA